MRVTLLVGTTKGLFLLTSHDRKTWTTAGPLCEGWPINHAIGEPGTGAIWAAGGSNWHGAGVFRSGDGGETWARATLAHGEFEDWVASDPAMAENFGLSPSPPAPYTGEVTALWSLARVGGTLYAGAKPAALYASHDGGETWAKAPGLTDHPSRDSWQPGGAGLVLHTIFADPAEPRKLWVAISSAGAFASEDGGETWERRNRRDNAAPSHHAPHPGHTDTESEVGHCVHNMVRAPGAEGDLLYQQNHEGVFRSRDGGRNWTEITAGLPSGFGFPVAVSPHDPEKVWVLPLNGDILGRFPPGASAAVWHSADGGETWGAEREGLPQANCFFTVLRQAMATDVVEPAGVYFGTNSGSVFARTDGTGKWQEIAQHLPTVLSVETVTDA